MNAPRRDERRDDSTEARADARSFEIDITVQAELAPAATTAVLLADAHHRPWPLPRRAWLMSQTWHDLLFAHWRVRPELVRPLLPHQLQLDTRDGWAWVGVVPFRVAGNRLRGLPLVPGASDFIECNLRTYVTGRGRPGVWFFSLDASSRIAVAGARLGFHLPYHHAAMTCEHEGPSRVFGRAVRYSSRRESGEHSANVRVRYQPTGEPELAAAGTLEHWLTERYCLFCIDRNGDLRSADIHHLPWRLQPARADFDELELSRAHGVEYLAGEPHLSFARRQDVLIWPPALNW